MTLKLKAKLQDDVDSWVIKLNTDVAKKFDMKRNTVCEIFNRDRGTSRFCNVRLSKKVDKDVAIINREIAQLDGTDNDDQLELVAEESINAKELLLRIEVEGVSREEQLKTLSAINENNGELIHTFFRRKKPAFNQGSKIYWKEMGLNLRIVRVSPFPYASYVPGTKIRVALTTPFNGILMVDTSGSMFQHKIPNIPGSLRLSDDPSLNKLRYKSQFNMLDDVIYTIENNAEVSRLYAALSAVLLYFSEKAERELSEKVGLICYSNKATIAAYRFKGENRYWLQVGKGGIEDAEEYKEMLVKSLFNYIGENTKKVTHGYNAFVDAWKLFKLMAKEDEEPMPTMLVILSDGEFNGDKGSFATEEDVRQVSNKVIEFVKKGFATDKRVVINAVYIGDDKSPRGKIAVETLETICKMTNGSVIQPKRLIELAKFYENAAQSLIYDLGIVEYVEGMDEEDIEEDEEE